VLLLRDHLRVGRFPQRHAAGVIAVPVRQHDVLDRPGVLALKQFLGAGRAHHGRRIDDDVAGRGRDQKGIAEAVCKIDRVVDAHRRLLAFAGAQRIVDADLRLRQRGYRRKREQRCAAHAAHFGLRRRTTN
jgi:hypothetical protein